MKIETKNLILISGNKKILASAIRGAAFLSNNLNASVSEPWTEFGLAPIEYSLTKISQNEYENGWWTYFPIHKDDKRLIGSCGYKGIPTSVGNVEIGYEVISEYRQKGLGTEIAKGLVSNAFKFDNVKMIIAHTLPSENASTNILKRLGFDKVSEIFDPEDGLIWRWELKRER
ncbi:MAG: GNAT family N-acetyltransferase [Saprospiraceae bacterium]|nr:GNAT family N-acetyltransferase [Candidatus Vicinibacter affinis]MBK7800944.1 GNAT family N-acetyltransferase [Candidatus Vicinibacter affinis]MBK8643658.1 GNAT family N-acetyltransferase [Candidatus Vicinibacter affinis]